MKKWAPRFGFFVEHGLLDAIPTPRQVNLATVRMLLFAANETQVEHRVNRRSVWGTIPLRVPIQLLYCPQQGIVWNGLLATKSTLVKHLLSSFHEDGVIAYDLQLLHSHPGGLAEVERQADDVARGRHVLAPVLSRVAGAYHAHLAELARAAQRFDYPRDMHPHFSSLVGFGRYCLRL